MSNNMLLVFNNWLAEQATRTTYIKCWYQRLISEAGSFTISRRSFRVWLEVDGDKFRIKFTN